MIIVRGRCCFGDEALKFAGALQLSNLLADLAAGAAQEIRDKLD